MTGMKTINERAQDVTRNIHHDRENPIAPKVALGLRLLVGDAIRVVDQYWSEEEIRRGCELCNVAKSISDEMRASLLFERTPEFAPEVRHCPARMISGEMVEPPRATLSVERRAQKMIETYQHWQRGSGADTESLKILFQTHLYHMVEACADLVDARRREVVRQCGGDEGLIMSPDSMTFTGYSVATMLAQIAESMRDFSQHSE